MSRTGKVYRVNAYAVSDECPASVENRNILQSKGWLWTCKWERANPDSGYRTYKSVATGEMAPWADNELEEVK